MYSPKLINVVYLNLDYPGSYPVPPSAKIDSIEFGRCVKVCSVSETFWIAVTQINKFDFYEGIVIGLLLKQDFSMGDFVTFKRENIIDIGDLMFGLTPNNISQFAEMGRRKLRR